MSKSTEKKNKKKPNLAETGQVRWRKLEVMIFQIVSSQVMCWSTTMVKDLFKQCPPKINSALFLAKDLPVTTNGLKPTQSRPKMTIYVIRFVIFTSRIHILLACPTDWLLIYPSMTANTGEPQTPDNSSIHHISFCSQSGQSLFVVSKLGWVNFTVCYFSLETGGWSDDWELETCQSLWDTSNNLFRLTVSY